MAYDEELAHRVRSALSVEDGVVEKRMFGGLCFMLRGNMACGIVKDELMVRVGPERYESVLALEHARPMDFTGRALKGMIYVDRAGTDGEEELARWVQMGVDFAGSLPEK